MKLEWQNESLCCHTHEDNHRSIDWSPNDYWLAFRSFVRLLLFILGVRVSCKCKFFFIRWWLWRWRSFYFFSGIYFFSIIRLSSTDNFNFLTFFLFRYWVKKWWLKFFLCLCLSLSRHSFHTFTRFSLVSLCVCLCVWTQLCEHRCSQISTENIFSPNKKKSKMKMKNVVNCFFSLSLSLSLPLNLPFPIPILFFECCRINEWMNELQ